MPIYSAFRRFRPPWPGYTRAAAERAAMEEEPSSSRAFLRAKIQIGSCKGPVSFQQAQTVFHHDDVPERSRQRRQDVLEWNKSRILDANRSAWNQSTDPCVPVVERRKMENHVADRSRSFQYNYRAETLDPLKMTEPVDISTKFHISSQLSSTAKAILTLKQTDPLQAGRLHRTQELPVNPKLENAAPWNSTTVMTVKEQSEGLKAMTGHAQGWTSKISATLHHKKDYVGPMKSVRLMQEKIREMKRSGNFSSDVVFNRPVSEPVDRAQLKNHCMVGKLNTVTSTVHSGVWGPNAVDGRPMWSDTGSYKFESRGDVVKKINLDQMNFADPVKSSRKMLLSSSKPSTAKSSRPHSSTLDGGGSVSSGTLSRTR